MPYKTKCDACGGENLASLYTLDKIPAFQNLLFPTKEKARAAQAASVNLTRCRDCDLVFNANFQSNLMEYGENYQNAQDHSAVFRAHLEDIAQRILSNIDKDNEKVIEIGCGKGYFLNMLLEQGVSVKGYDPTFEGESPYVEKRYFSRDVKIEGDVHHVIMRHTLEHIEKPRDFLLELKAFLPADTQIFIEIPRFEWIEENAAFWDIFHEHCNYFTEAFFQGIFSGRADIARVFGEQYMLVKGRIGDLTNTVNIDTHTTNMDADLAADIKNIHAEIETYKNNYVWGAGAKGIAFCNILDPEATQIKAIIDINPNKQGSFVPLCATTCVSPNDIDWGSLSEDSCLWIMNPNYREEILASLPPSTSLKVRTL